VGTLSAVSARRAVVPRTNSWPIVARTNAANVYAMRPGIEDPEPSRMSTRPTASAIPAGQANTRTSPRSDARRQATSGPMPISRSSGKPKIRKKKS
jgi:hypothetical protein